MYKYSRKESSYFEDNRTSLYRRTYEEHLSSWNINFKLLFKINYDEIFLKQRPQLSKAFHQDRKLIVRNFQKNLQSQIRRCQSSIDAQFVLTCIAIHDTCPVATHIAKEKETIKSVPGYSSYVSIEGSE